MEILNKILSVKLQLKHCYAYTPEELWEAFKSYVLEYSNGCVIKKVVNGGPLAGTEFSTIAERPLSVKSFCAYAQIATINKGWDNAIDEILRSDHPACTPYRDVANLINDFIEAQVLEGGMLNKFNASLASKAAQGHFNKAYMQDSTGGTSKIEHTINFKNFKSNVDKTD